MKIEGLPDRPQRIAVQCSQGAPRKRCPDPQCKRTYLYMLVLESSWAYGSGKESAHCCSSHCSALSCWALVSCCRTGWRAPCPVQISTSSKCSMASGPDQVLAGSAYTAGNGSLHIWAVDTLVQGLSSRKQK